MEDDGPESPGGSTAKKPHGADKKTVDALRLDLGKQTVPATIVDPLIPAIILLTHSLNDLQSRTMNQGENDSCKNMTTIRMFSFCFFHSFFSFFA